MATTLAQKLQMKPGQRLAVLNAPAGYLDRLTAELAGIVVSAEPATADAVLLFVQSLEEATGQAPGVMHSGPTGGLLWIAYPKGTSKVKTDVNRDRLWEALLPTGWRPVRQVALDDIWPAIRFRPAHEVGQ
jgi:hypothetical protein